MLIVQLGNTQLFVELDAQVIVNLVLAKKKPSTSSYSPLLNDCRYLLGQFHRIKINHVFREANRCVDNLARAGCSFFGNFIVLDLPPTNDLCNFLSSDAAGLYSFKAFSHYFIFYG